ncbi:MAG: CPBP family intramembrane metalloprotease [Lachnospiraceae bacterium]|nr:CPBP family intramembrane metalloprotease [Lachnospiraceae bacterium]
MNRKHVKRAEWCCMVFCAVCAGLGLNALVSWLSLDRLSDTYGQVRTAQYAVSVLQGVVKYGILAPVLEELIFRGVVYRICVRRIPWQAAAVVSAVLFAVYHGNMIQGCYAFVMGLLLGYVYHHFDTLAAPILFHGAANLAVFLVSYSSDTIPQAMLPAVAIVGILAAGGLLAGLRHFHS